MRPVNLIPPEERRGANAPLRTGPLAYLLLGGLVLVLLGVIALVLTGNQIADREAEIAKLEQENDRAAAKAQRLARYTEFQALSEQRVATVSQLADSRFDWERVMRELALVLPADVSLTNFEATAGGEGESESGGPAPTLTLSGCAAGQEGVAGFVTALKDIDGVTRVSVESSAVADDAGGGPAASTEVGSDSGSAGSCAGADAATFEMLVTFDAAPVADVEGEAEAAATEATSEAEEGAG